MTFTATRWHQHRAGMDDIVIHRPWSDDDLAEAIRMRRAGHGATAIGKKLKRTRNSVIGALHRAGEPGVIQNPNTAGYGRFSRLDQPARVLPMRFSEQRRVP